MCLKRRIDLLFIMLNLCFSIRVQHQLKVGLSWLSSPMQLLYKNKWKNDWKCREERDAWCSGLLWFRSHMAPSSCALRVQTSDLIFEFFQCALLGSLSSWLIEETAKSKIQGHRSQMVRHVWELMYDSSHLCDKSLYNLFDLINCIN